MKLLITVLLAIVVLASSAFAENVDTRARLMTLFSDRHYVAREAAIKNSGEDVPGTLKEMANDKNLLTFLRIRAVNALGFFSSAQVGEFLRITASASTLQIAVRSEAISALGNSERDGATQFIVGFLKDSNLLIKSSATHSLISIGSASARAALREADGATTKPQR